jgi:acetylornithine deacetylase/succinyl-diaminopimelate desuccinylase-like protein
MYRFSLAFLTATALIAQTPDWSKINPEFLRDYSAVVQMDTTDPPGNETIVVDYVKRALEAEGIPVITSAKVPNRANLIARVKGNGSKRPLLIMGHTDTVKVDLAKWGKFGPFSAARDSGYIYGRGTLDDKDNMTAGMMTLILLKRLNVPLDRDVIFVAEAGEEAASNLGIGHLVENNWSDIDAEICMAEGGQVDRRDGVVRYAAIQTAEKSPRGAKLVAHGTAGHGARPIASRSAIVHLSRAVEKIATWDPPMRLNDTTREYFEKIVSASPPELAQVYKDLFDPNKSAAARAYLAEHDANQYSMLHTSISPNVLTAGYASNVIPSEATATLDIRALPDEDMPKFYELMKQVINDPAVEIVPNSQNTRPQAPASKINNEAFHAIEAANRKVYNVPTVPSMSPGATDLSYLRARGVQCYGVGSMVDVEDAAKGFAQHSDQERVLEEALYKFLQFNWEVATSLAASKR